VAHRFKDLWSRAITFSRAIIRLSRDLMRQHKPQHRQEPDESRHHHRNEQYAHDPIRPAVKRAIVHFDCLPAYRPSIIRGLARCATSVRPGATTPPTSASG
jgi:hypothetical protein